MISNALYWMRAFGATLLLSGMSGCGALSGLMETRPTAEVVGVAIQDVNLQSLSLRFDIEISNPYSVPLPLVNLDFSLVSKGLPFLSGKVEMQGTVPAQGRRTVSMPTKVSFLEVLAVLKEVRPGAVVPYAAEMGLSVDAPAVGTLRLPLKKEGQLPVPTVPTVELAEIRWQKLALDGVEGMMRVGLTNRNQYPVDLSRFHYGLVLAGEEVASTSVAKSISFAADGGKAELEIPLSFSPQKAGFAFLRMLMGEGAGYRLKGSLEIGTPFGPMSLPVDVAGKTVFKR